jgi:hypothetical protein
LTPAFHIAAMTARALGVDQAKVGAAAKVARDRDEVDHRIDPGERRLERVGASHVADPDLDPLAAFGRQPAYDDLAGRRRPGQRHDAMAGRQQGGHVMAADEAAGAGHEDGRHGWRVASAA